VGPDVTPNRGAHDVLVGIDVGTTRVKAVVVDLTGTELAAATVETPWVVDGQAVELDAAALTETVHTVVVAALDQRGGDDRVVGVGVTGVGESGVLLDRHGEPASPIIAWYDQRGDVELVAKELPDLVAHTGVRIDPVATIFKLPGLLRDYPGVRWLNVAEWVVRSLGGEQLAEISLAGRTGLCDLHTGTWWPEALEFLGVDESFLPGDPGFGTAGAGQASFAPIAGARLAVAGHDHQVAAYVVGAIEPGRLFESLGTADALTLTVPGPVDRLTVVAVVDSGATIGRTVVADRLMVMTGLRTGQILERIARLLGVGDRTKRRALSDRAAGRVHDPALSVDLVAGLVTITGIGDDTDAAALWAAAVDAADRQTRDVVTRYTELFGPAADVVVGGGWLNDPTIEAAVRRRFPTARRSRFGEPGAVGAACVAGISAGVLDGPFADAIMTRGEHP
jgi:sugar (pentulose or hexulose) kinase